MEIEIHSFIVRIWNEASEQPSANAVWRGSIEHVGTGKRLYFSNGQAILSFIWAQVGGEEPPDEPTWKSLLPWVNHEDR